MDGRERSDARKEPEEQGGWTDEKEEKRKRAGDIDKEMRRRKTWRSREDGRTRKKKCEERAGDEATLQAASD